MKSSIASEWRKDATGAERLPETYGLALLWRYWENRSVRDMAEATRKTDKAVERLLARARARFRELWEQV